MTEPMFCCEEGERLDPTGATICPNCAEFNEAMGYHCLLVEGAGICFNAKKAEAQQAHPPGDER